MILDVEKLSEMTKGKIDLDEIKELLTEFKDLKELPIQEQPRLFARLVKVVLPVLSAVEEVFDELDAMIGVRLHSTLIATVLGKPALHLFYSPKGLSYFRRINKEEFCVPLKCLLSRDKTEYIAHRIDALVEKNRKLSMEIAKSVETLKEEFTAGYLVSGAF